MRPGGDEGLRAPDGGPISSEHQLVQLDNGDLYTIFRTVQGSPAYAISSDGGKTWSEPAFLRYSPEGRRIRHPRACPALEKFSNGKYLLWFHNHAGKTYDDRNPVWVTGGIERNGTIHWSEPEILLYDPDPSVRISYPDFIEDDDGYYVTETQKTIARVHKIDPSLLEAVWQQHQRDEVARDGLVFEQTSPADQTDHDGPKLGDLSKGAGFTVDFAFTAGDRPAGQVLVESGDPTSGNGFWQLVTGPDQTVRLRMSDGRRSVSWRSDRGLTEPGQPHYLTFIVDGRANIITVLVDGKVCDGRGQRQFGWGRFSDELGLVSGGGSLSINLDQALHGLRIYDRALRVSEAVGNARAGFDP
jgi:hypothetical protein